MRLTKALTWSVLFFAHSKPIRLYIGGARTQPVSAIPFCITPISEA
jgi:hypothetical protein